MKTKRGLLLMALYLVISMQSFSQTTIGRQLVDQFPTTPWNTMTYGLTWLPTDYSLNTTQKYPLILFFHGSGEGGDGIGGLWTLISQGLPRAIANGVNPEAVNPVDGQRYKFIVVSPQAPWAMHWSYGFGAIQYILADVMARYRVDPERVYVTGLSAGGSATYSTVTNGPVFAQKIAAIFPICPAGSNTPTEFDQLPLVGGTYGVKVWSPVGAVDALYNWGQNAVNSINSATPAPAIPAIFTAMPGVGHEPAAWNPPYDTTWRPAPVNLNMYEWMLQYKRATNLPTASAGSPQTITFPLNQVTLNGSGSAASGNSITGYAWTQVSGPSSATIVSASNSSTLVTGLIQGSYVFKLTVTDNLNATAFATVTITVNPVPNILPVAHAGSDQVITLPVNSVSLNGSGTDADGSIISYQWNKISGPTQFNITNGTSAFAGATNLVQGFYQFELMVTDNSGATAKDTVSVTVNPAPPPPNTPPVANAGTDITITLPVTTATLNGSAVDSDGTISFWQWTKISGPSQFSIVNPSQAITDINNLVAGTYSFSLRVTDNSGAVDYDTVSVQVNPAVPANQPPVVNAGLDQSIILPVDSTDLSGTGMDSDGTIVSWQWTKISGPASGTITTPSQPDTRVIGLVQGIYYFQLTVTDDDGSSSSDILTVNVSANVPPNLPPAAFAGNDMILTLPTDSVLLNGVGSDTDGSVSSYLWRKIQGPSCFISDSTSSNTTAHQLLEGIYSFEFTVTDDSGAVAKDTVMVQVNPAVVVSGCNGVKRYMLPGGDGGRYINADPLNQWYQQVNPGDTLVLSASYPYNYFGLEGYSGTAACPIVVLNEGGQVWLTSGINAKNCRYIKITGSGASNSYYGFKVYNPGVDQNGVAICINGKSSSIEVERIDVYKKTYGVWAKQDPMCDTSYNYPNYIMDSIEIHHSRFRNIGQDCIYAGNTDPLGYREVNCNGVIHHYIPMRLSNINIHHLNIDSCSRTGIQLSGASGGYNQIHDNLVTRCGYEYNQWQGTGIAIGGMTRNCHVYNNTVKNTFLYGILSFGVGTNYIENNIIDSTGYLDGSPNMGSQPSNILVSPKETLPFDSTTIIIRNNKLGRNSALDSTNVAVVLWGPATFTNGNIVCGNTRLNGITPALVYVDPNIQYINNCSTPAGNLPPVVNAGDDQVITTAGVDSTILSGQASDADGYIISYHWSLVSGPGQYTFSNPDSMITNVTGLMPGEYTFRLTATDDDSVTATDDVIITISMPNVAPIANAGPNQIIFLPTDSVTLNGSALDYDGSITSWHWSMISGPSSTTISSFTTPQTIVSGLVEGFYYFELSVTDNNGVEDRDTIMIRVNPEPPFTNIPPVANGGQDKIITLPTDFVSLDGSGTDADGTVTTYLWSELTGPASYTLSTYTAGNTILGNLVQGTYKFILTVTDNQGSIGRDTVTISVLPAPNVPPVADAGPDKTITLPVNSVTLSGSATDADGTVTTYQWTKISGPSAFTISTFTQLQTVVSGLVQGVYQFELRVADNNGAMDRDTVTITVNPAVNIPPVAHAGNDITITLPVNSVTLNGSGSDADGIVSTYQWTKISGPATFNIVSSNQAQTNINNLVQGVYLFVLTVTDNQGSAGTDTMMVTVNPASNISPVASAGNDVVITLPVNSATLSGSGTDADGSIISYSWTKVSGPASYQIVNPLQAQTAVNALLQGTYQFVLTVTDNQGASDTDTMNVIVHAANIPPVAHAGTDITIQLPVNSVTLNGSGTDADGTVTGWQWTKISGPSQFIIAHATQPVTAFSNLVQGVYQMELKVTDNQGASARDTIIVTVLSPNVPPVSNAGLDQVITLPVNSVTLHGSGTDADGTVDSYNWTKISGPSVYTIGNASSAQTIIHNLVQGVYKFELRVTDNQGATARDTVNVIVNPAGNQPPVVNAGMDRTLTLPLNQLILNGTVTDLDGTIASLQWTKISGPTQYIISTSTQASTIVSNLIEGTYLFELRATDNLGATGRDTVAITINTEQLTYSTASLYPNPVKVSVNIRIDAITHRNVTSLKIYDAKGAVVYKEEFLRTQQVVIKSIDVSKFEPGVYLVVLDVDINNKHTLKFVKK